MSSTVPTDERWFMEELFATEELRITSYPEKLVARGTLISEFLNKIRITPDIVSPSNIFQIRIKTRGELLRTFQTIFFQGLSGVGKTYVLSWAKEWFFTSSRCPDIVFTIVDLTDQTTYKGLKVIAAAFATYGDYPSNDDDDLARAIQTFLDVRKKHFVIVLDNLQSLNTYGKKTLNSFLNRLLTIQNSLKRSSVTWVFVVNKNVVFSDTNDIRRETDNHNIYIQRQVHGRFGSSGRKVKLIRVKSYTPEELFIICKQRIEIGWLGDTISDELINMMIQTQVNSGDARLVIENIKTCLGFIFDRGSKSVTEELVRESGVLSEEFSAEIADEVKLRERLSGLNGHQKALLVAAAESTIIFSQTTGKNHTREKAPTKTNSEKEENKEIEGEKQLIEGHYLLATYGKILKFDQQFKNLYGEMSSVGRKQISRYLDNLNEDKLLVKKKIHAGRKGPQMNLYKLELKPEVVYKLIMETDV